MPVIGPADEEAKNSPDMVDGSAAPANCGLQPWKTA